MQLLHNQSALLPPWLQTPAGNGINYTSHLTRLMHDIIARVPALSFIDMSRVLVFARPGRSCADGPYASCHSLGLPPTEPGYYYWRDRHTGGVTRRTEWFVTKSPRVVVSGRAINYLISFALPRFTDQTLTRSRKRGLYPAATPDWVAKLDTVIHELYHIDPAQDCLRRFRRADGSVSDALHNPTYFEEVAAMVQEYLDTRPHPELLEFLKDDFATLRGQHGAVTAVTFRSFPAYPRRYREAVDGPALPLDVEAAPIEKIVDSSARSFADDDLQLRAFTGRSARLAEREASEPAEIAA